jgi:hypothetical protein
MLKGWLQQDRTVGEIAMKVLFALAAALLLSAISEAHAQRSYPLVCRGGGTMKAEVLANGTMRMFFTPAFEGANNAPPQAGQCTWLDRAFRDGEPHVLLTTYGEARIFLDAMVAGRPFNAHVFNNKAGAMQVTRVGP